MRRLREHVNRPDFLEHVAGVGHLARAGGPSANPWQTAGVLHILAGAVTNLSVIATGDALKFQWYLNSGAIANAISATASILSSTTRSTSARPFSGSPIAASAPTSTPVKVMSAACRPSWVG